ncbi:hypothetical protein JOD63_000904 [Microbacterium terrae]|uniref:DUF1206 domain-containing protein n=1 Tax=Microbacterium terrae TaxID=69369 RepID=A0A0M2H0T5_9MICO|nr:DUF1206 domain-containing protein [Microbacterium terrae]KJL39996.1 hypothetical protein RS81_01816 [Microbacterium terrae]MBP1076936.1 hypothetical protein [Microbacterium terrae]GLJ99530.1 hypothetical protein GCM10017594_27280 [Microbacterium terrae]
MSTAKNAARAAQDSPAFRVIARIGYVVLGVVHIVIGAIAIPIATGGGGGEADQGGAMEQIRSSPAGVVLLWVIVIGLTALAVWQVAEAFLQRDPDAKRKWGYRIKNVGTAVAYLAIAFTALVFALGGSSDSSDSSTTLSAGLMSSPGGLIVLILVGVVVFAIGVAFVVRGLTRGFEEQLALPGGVARSGIVTFGVVGYVAKGIAVGVAGVLFVVAAFTHDPEKAGGLDAALHALAELPFGSLILWVVAVGLIVYGVFCFARARYARM